MKPLSLIAGVTALILGGVLQPRLEPASVPPSPPARMASNAWWVTLAEHGSPSLQFRAVAHGRGDLGIAQIDVWWCDPRTVTATTANWIQIQGSAKGLWVNALVAGVYYPRLEIWPSTRRF